MKTDYSNTELETFFATIEDQGLLYPTGFERAIVGIVEMFMGGEQVFRIALSETRCIEILAEEMGWNQAREFYSTNIVGTYMDGVCVFISTVEERI